MMSLEFQHEHKKALQNFLQGPSISISGKKAKGEEKPEEELMGNLKSSPRLATTSVRMLLPSLSPIIMILYIFQANLECGDMCRDMIG